MCKYYLVCKFVADLEGKLAVKGLKSYINNPILLLNTKLWVKE